MGDEVRGVPDADLGGSERPPLREGPLAHELRPGVSSGPEVDDYRNWTPDAQQKALSRLRALTEQTDNYKPFYCGVPDCDGKPHGEWAWKHGRADQVPPPWTDDWLLLLLLGGRGSGKTRAGSEMSHRVTKIAPRMALVGPTGTSVRDVIVEGDSGILATAPPGMMPQWEPSKRRLTWPNGAQATAFSAEEPDRLRGPQYHFAWLDEPAHMPLIKDVWDNLLFGLRLGQYPRVIGTTTPKPIPWVREQVANPLTVVRRVSTYANLDNLAPTFARTILERYEGTRIGRQELYGEILEDVEGALWNWEMLDAPGSRLPAEFEGEYQRVVVGIDPAGTARTRSDETGIVVCAKIGDHYYVLADGSGKMSPNRWASVSVSLAEQYAADCLVPEKNYGGDMVTQTLRSIDSNIRIKPVTSRRGKALRAEPIVSLYEQGRVHHVGAFPVLEDQMCSWVPTDGRDSPDRVDALVHAITELSKGGGLLQIASPLDLFRR